MRSGLYRCSRSKYHLSVTAGTIFQDSRIPLRLWFRAIWQVVSQKLIKNVSIPRLTTFTLPDVNTALPILYINICNP